MRMKAGFIWFTIGLFVVAIGSVAWLSSESPEKERYPQLNKNMLDIKSFRAASDSTDLNTTAEGTIFVRGEEGRADSIQIAVEIVIDPDDWGGVSLNFPDKWQITELSSSFPEPSGSEKAQERVIILTSPGNARYATIVEIGRSHTYKPTGGGKGTVLLTLSPDRRAELPESMMIAVAVGSDLRSGYRVAGSDFIEIPLKLIDE